MISVLSVSFKTTPLDVREQLVLSAEETPSLLRELRAACGIEEVMVLSTCNRVEFYCAEPTFGPGGNRVADFLQKRFPAIASDLSQSLVVLRGQDALTHLFRVTCSLESLVIGEPQILGQVKEAYKVAVESGAAGPELGGLMPRAFRAAKRVRSETQIARYPVSVSFVAVELARKIFDTLEAKTVLVIGAGKMAELAVAHLREAGVRHLLITNRTFTRAVALAERVHGSAVRFEELGHYLAEADIVISSTDAPEPVVTRELARQAMKQRKGTPMFFIDIAVPRDIDPEVHLLPNVYCYDIDDLKAVVDTNRSEREREALAAQKIVREEVRAYGQWRDSLATVPTIRALRRRFSEVAEQEVAKALAKMGPLSGEDTARVNGLARRIVNRLLHSPSTRLKQLEEGSYAPLYLDALTSLFDLEDFLPGETEAEEEEQSANVLRLPIEKIP